MSSPTHADLSTNAIAFYDQFLPLLGQEEANSEKVQFLDSTVYEFATYIAENVYPQHFNSEGKSPVRNFQLIKDNTDITSPADDLENFCSEYKGIEVIDSENYDAKDCAGIVFKLLFGMREIFREQSSNLDLIDLRTYVEPTVSTKNGKTVARITEKQLKVIAQRLKENLETLKEQIQLFAKERGIDKVLNFDKNLDSLITEYKLKTETALQDFIRVRRGQVDTANARQKAKLKAQGHTGPVRLINPDTAPIYDLDLITREFFHKFYSMAENSLLSIVHNMAVEHIAAQNLEKSKGKDKDLSAAEKRHIQNELTKKIPMDIAQCEHMLIKLQEKAKLEGANQGALQTAAKIIQIRLNALRSKQPGAETPAEKPVKEAPSEDGVTYAASNEEILHTLLGNNFIEEHADLFDRREERAPMPDNGDAYTTHTIEDTPTEEIPSSRGDTGSAEPSGSIDTGDIVMPIFIPSTSTSGKATPSDEEESTASTGAAASASVPETSSTEEDLLEALPPVDTKSIVIGAEELVEAVRSFIRTPSYWKSHGKHPNRMLRIKASRGMTLAEGIYLDEWNRLAQDQAHHDAVFTKVKADLLSKKTR